VRVCVCMCACVRAHACSLARLPSNHAVGFHESCSEDMTDRDQTEKVINLCCIVYRLTRGKSTGCRDALVRCFTVPGSRFAMKLDVRCTVCFLEFSIDGCLNDRMSRDHQVNV
jgi:hypothetical protein